ncbi:MAG: hypothetical protein MJ230_05415 [bacterium]|nr:hypothetical protein [bacterium]
MKNTIFALMLLILSFVTVYGSYFYFNDIYRLVGIFVSGILFGIFLMIIKLNVKNDRLKTYKRELEKESISSDESSAKVKVLESKIEVLEKALENALKK